MREIQVFGGLSGRGRRPAGDPAGASFARAPRVAGAAPAGSHAPRELAGWFWPEIAEDAARTNLRSALTELRQGLGIASRLLAADRERVALTGAWGDAPAFAELAIAGRLAEAEALCRSELLAGVDDELVYAACAEHERRLAELLARLPGAWTRNAVVGDFRSGTGRLSADGLDRRDTPPLAGKAGVPIVLEQTTGLDEDRRCAPTLAGLPLPPGKAGASTVQGASGPGAR